MTPVDFLLRYMHSAPPIPEHLQRADHICLYERVGFSGPFNPVCLIDLTEEGVENYSLSRFWHLAVMHDKSKVLDKSLNASVPMIDHPSVFFSTQNTVEDRGVLRNWSQTSCKWYPNGDNEAVQLPTRQFFAC